MLLSVHEEDEAGNATDLEGLAAVSHDLGVNSSKLEVVVLSIKRKFRLHH